MAAAASHSTCLVLTDIGTHVTIVEKDEAKCLTLAEKLPKVTVIHGDGTNHDLLESEGIFHCDAFIAVTDRDEKTSSWRSRRSATA